MAECPHGMGDPSWCALCKGVDKPEAGEPYTFPARFEGKCGECGDKIMVGELITHVDGGPYSHAECV